MTRGRPGTGNYRYRRLRAIMLATDDTCGICGHPGALTADHIVPARDWPRDDDGKPLPGMDELENLRPAHGTRGPFLPPNPCPTCRLLCNQVRGTGVRLVGGHSRDW